MIVRELSENALQLATQYPVVTITGPRQSGKTTLCRMLFRDRAYVSLEDLDQRDFARRDPRGFLSRFPGGPLSMKFSACRSSCLTSRLSLTESTGTDCSF